MSAVRADCYQMQLNARCFTVKQSIFNMETFSIHVIGTLQSPLHTIVFGIVLIMHLIRQLAPMKYYFINTSVTWSSYLLHLGLGIPR